MKDKLVRRDEIAIPNRKANEYNIRKYIKNHLKDIDEILQVLDLLPATQVDKLFSLEDIKRLELYEEKIIEHVVIPPIERGTIIYRFDIKDQLLTLGGVLGDETTMKVLLPAKDNEVALIDQMARHVEVVRKANAPHKDEKIYSLREFNKKKLPGIAEFAAKRGQTYHIGLEDRESPTE
jgi:hypothetical protein